MAARVVAETCDQPPILFGASLGGSIAARFAIQHPDELVKLILMDSGSLAAFRPAPSVLLALIRFSRAPNLTTAQKMQEVIFYDAQRVRTQMGERMTAFLDYQMERAKQLTVRAANRTLLRTLGTKRIPDDELRRIASPVSLVWGRHDRVMKFGSLRGRVGNSAGRCFRSMTPATSRPQNSPQPSARHFARFSRNVQALVSRGTGFAQLGLPARQFQPQLEGGISPCSTREQVSPQPESTPPSSDRRSGCDGLRS